MRHYFFVASLLPPLSSEIPIDFSFADLIFACQVNLSKNDLQKVETLRFYFDLQNLYLLIKNEQSAPFQEVANFSKAELEDAVMRRDGLPEYVCRFLERYETQEERLGHFSSLFCEYFNFHTATSSGFLQNYLIFERDLRLVLTAFRAKKMGRDLSFELRYQDPKEELVTQMMAQKDAQLFEPPKRFEELKELFTKADQPLALYQALYEYRYKKVEEMLGTDLFSIDRILGYIAQFIALLNWSKLDKNKGLHLVDQVVKGTE